MTLTGHDLVISSSSGFAHGVQAPGAFHLCYCYTPPRWLYRGETYLGPGGPVPQWALPLLRPVLSGLRYWDQIAAQRPDAYLGVSRAVANRIQEVYRRSAQVIHPPVDIERLRRHLGYDDLVERDALPRNRPPLYVVVARLLPYKRVELAIRACRQRRATLVVVGDGPELARLRCEADDTAIFRSELSDLQLARLIASSTAVIQAGEEDFGLVPLEANAIGVPAVAYAGGGALETVLDGVTGVLFSEPTAESLQHALDRVEAGWWDPAVLRAHARRFDEARFGEALLDYLADTLRFPRAAEPAASQFVEARKQA